MFLTHSQKKKAAVASSAHQVSSASKASSPPPSTPPTQLADADLGRLLLCHFTSLLRSLPTLPGSEVQRTLVCIASLHTALRAACPKYATDACLSADVCPPAADPLPSTEAGPGAGLPPGTVLVQWAVQDGCWQVPASFQSDGALPQLAVADADVLALPPPTSSAAMLYVVVTHTGEARVGERVFDVPTVRALHGQLRAACRGGNGGVSGAQPHSELFGHPAFSTTQLTSSRRMVERLLAGLRLSEDGSVANATSTHAADVATSSAAAPPSEAAVATPDPTARPAAAPSKGGKAGTTKPAAGAPPAGGGAAAPCGPPVVPPPTDLGFLSKLEAVLNVEDGVDVVDPNLAEFLASVLPTA